MSLEETQIVRYSRQILLEKVGGRGQERLLDAAIELTGRGSAQSVAAAYLLGAGSSLHLPPREVQASEVGFHFGASEVGQPMLAASAVVDANPDLRPGAAAGGQLGEGGHFDGPGPWVVVGQDQGADVVVFSSERGCRGCFELSRRALFAPCSEASSVMVGALAALAHQRLLLGWSDGPGALQVKADGSVGEWPLTRCPQHATR